MPEFRTKFAEKFSGQSGIGELMDDLGAAMASGEMYMLGGGNPARIEEINRLWTARFRDLLMEEQELSRALLNYDTPQGHNLFLESLSSFLSEELKTEIRPENIAVTNGSQSAFFYLLNLLGGTCSDGIRRKILFPLVPEYIGYADQHLEDDAFLGLRPRIEETAPRRFKYHIDFEALENVKEPLGAVCISRPTNPSGNVLTDSEVAELHRFCKKRNIPLVIDNAYGAPFPQILFKEINLFWDKDVILSMSLSKLGLPSTRTGIIVADEKIIKAVSSVNAILSLATGNLGQVITHPLIKDKSILRLSHEVVRPFYREKSLKTQAWIEEYFGNIPYSIHESEGAIFLWVWFRDLPINTDELYQRLKKRGVLIIPGKYFFYGLKEPWDHRQECVRLTYSQEDETIRRGIEIIGEELRQLR